MGFQIRTANTGENFYLTARLEADGFGDPLTSLAGYGFYFVVIDDTAGTPVKIIEADHATDGGITITGLQIRVKLVPDKVAQLTLEKTYRFFLKAKPADDAWRTIEDGLISRIYSPDATAPDVTVEIVTDEGGVSLVGEDGTTPITPE